MTDRVETIAVLRCLRCGKRGGCECQKDEDECNCGLTDNSRIASLTWIVGKCPIHKALGDENGVAVIIDPQEW